MAGRWWLWVVMFVGLAACTLEARLVECPGEVLCPFGTVCDLAHGGCISAEQATSCVGIADGDSCTAGALVGYCADQICIEPGCGNRIVDPGEVCDDGGRDTGDGCSATCSSLEVCGDGVLDVLLGEECDDGALQSRDGCDSRCLRETKVWTVDEVGPASANPHWTAYDRVREQLVMVMDGFVWGWNGTRWSVLDRSAPRLNTSYDVVFDPVRNTLVVIAAPPAAPDFVLVTAPRSRIFEWDGTTWTSGTTTNAPDVGTLATEMALTYDPVRQRVFAFGVDGATPVVATLDVAAGVWTTVAGPSSPGTPERGFALSFDEARGVAVVVTAGAGGGPAGDPVVSEWNGDAWMSTQAAMQSLGSWSLLYDPAIARVLAIGTGNPGSGSTPVQAWNGSTWSTLTAAPLAREAPSVAYDRARQVRVIFGGSTTAETDDVVEGTSTWTRLPRTTLPAQVDEFCAFDDHRQRIVCLGSRGNGRRETWAGNGLQWTPVDQSDLLFSGPLAYDPTRRAMLLVGADSLYTLTDAGWSPTVADDPAFKPATAMAFDPENRRMVATTEAYLVSPPYTISITPENVVSTASSPVYRSLAFDARNHGVVGVGATGAAQLGGSTWSPIPAPSIGYRLVSNPRRGSIEYYFPGLHILERSGLTWDEASDSPPLPVVGIPVMNATTGELSIVGAINRSRFILHRRWESSTPAEACAGSSDDLDGDGLAGCADPDCWTTCSPACPPFATCP